MKRRQFIALLGGLAAAPPAGVLAQGTQPAQSVRRVGLLGSGPPFGGKSPIVLGLGAAFKAHGYMVGRDVVFVGRAAAGDEKRLPGLVGELTASGVRLIVSLGYPAAVAAKEHTRLAVVAMNTGDPVATRLVESLSRPGGHVTGISDIASELAAKRLQLLTEAVPHVRKVAMLWNADNLGMTFRYKAARAAALRLHIEVQPLGVREPDDFGSAFAAMTKDPPDAILMVTDALTILNHRRVFEFAAAHRLPAIYEFDFLVRDGGLMSYGPDDAETYDRVAGLADRILKGANPADLPFEEPTRFVFAVNLKTAKAIGLEIPRDILARADEVIE
ncbi:MAG TPA: ABC transporter substrate-binding protein [Stellaceae bacterium]|nr:ABC transporter substrate-binding protein [Stellaceae bacterium]